MENLAFLIENLSCERKCDWGNINDGYLTQLNLIKGEEFGLPVDIEFDNNETYKRSNTPFSLYFRNSYLKENNWLPIEINNPDNIIFETKCLNITLSDYFVIKEFVIKYKNILKLVCENKIKTLDFLNTCQRTINTSHEPIYEMANLAQNDTGLPEKIWIDFGSSFKKGGHWIRIKAGDKDLATLTIPDYQWIGGDVLSEKSKRLIEKYVKINIEWITKATLGQISFSEYLANSIKVDSKGFPIKKLEIKEWVPFLKINSNLTIFKKNSLPVKYIALDNNSENIFKKDDGQNILFDSVYYLGNNLNKCFCTIGDKQYWLFGNGTLKEIEE